MDMRIFPFSNTYFNAGIIAICNAGSHFRKSREELVIVCLAPWSIKEIVHANWIENWCESKILFVTYPKFFPLARFFQRQNMDFIEVCSDSELISVLGYFLWRGKLYITEQDEDIPHLTYMEYISLQNALDGISANRQAKAMGLSSKTIFAHREAAARKLGVKKLSHLLSPGTLRYC